MILSGHGLKEVMPTTTSNKSKNSNKHDDRD